VDTMNNDNFVRITNKIVVYHSNASDYKLITKFLNRALTILTVITICFVLIVLDIPVLGEIAERIGRFLQ
jgi:hypothetical protein